MIEGASASSFPSGSPSILEYAQDDILHSLQRPNSYDCILDIGLLGALACAPVVARASCGLIVRAASEYFRLLRHGGLLVLVSGRERELALLPFATREWTLLREVRFGSNMGFMLSADERPIGDIGPYFRRCFMFALRRE